MATHHYGVKTSTLKDGNPSVLLIDTIEKFSDPTNRIQKYDIGREEYGYLSEKVILFVGETGTGKTTMINTIANYLLDNKWNDDHRYQLLSDSEETKSGESQVESRTKWITSYTFYVENKWFQNFTLIDSPGFGDTSGRKQDHTLREQMRVFFTNKGNSGIDHIDALALVVNASSKRLTENQKYIFDSVLHLFGKNISDNIFLVCTHATDDELESRNPDVAESLRRYQISFRDLFLFNNEFLYYQMKKGSRFSGLGRACTVWEMGEETLDEFIGKIFECTPKSLSLSSEVLEERRNLEITIQSLPNLIRSSLTYMNEIQKEMDVFEEHKHEMETNNDFTYTVEVVRKVQEFLDNGKEATVCEHCKITCHYPCKRDLFIVAAGLTMCAAMRPLALIRGCGVCPEHCAVSHHSLQSYRYVNIVETESRTKMNMKLKYHIAQSQMKFKENLIRRMTKEKDLAQRGVHDAVEKLRTCLDRLDEIALKTNPTSVLELLENLQREENQGMEPGYVERVAELGKLCELERMKYSNRKKFRPFWGKFFTYQPPIVVPRPQHSKKH